MVPLSPLFFLPSSPLLPPFFLPSSSTLPPSKIVKNLAVGIIGYWRTASLAFDGGVTILQMFGLILFVLFHATGGDEGPIPRIVAEFAALVQVFRVTRFLRLVVRLHDESSKNAFAKSGSGVNALSQLSLVTSTAIAIIPKVTWILAMWVLINYSFAIVGMESFGLIITPSTPGMNETSFGQQVYSIPRPTAKDLSPIPPGLWTIEYDAPTAPAAMVPPHTNASTNSTNITNSTHSTNHTRNSASNSASNSPGNTSVHNNMSSVTVYTYYSVANWDSLYQSYLTLFIMTIVNNWHVLRDGCAVAVRAQVEGQAVGDFFDWLVSIFFIAYYLVSVLVLTNVLVSTFLDHFTARVRHEELEEEEDTRQTEVDVMLSHIKGRPAPPPMAQMGGGSHRRSLGGSLGGRSGRGGRGGRGSIGGLYPWQIFASEMEAQDTSGCEADAVIECCDGDLHVVTSDTDGQNWQFRYGHTKASDGDNSNSSGGVRRSSQPVRIVGSGAVKKIDGISPLVRHLLHDLLLYFGKRPKSHHFHRHDQEHDSHHAFAEAAVARHSPSRARGEEKGEGKEREASPTVHSKAGTAGKASTAGTVGTAGMAGTADTKTNTAVGDKVHTTDRRRYNLRALIAGQNILDRDHHFATNGLAASDDLEGGGARNRAGRATSGMCVCCVAVCCMGTSN